MAAPTVGITSTPASWQRAMASFVGAPAKETTVAPARVTKSSRSERSGWSARKFTPKGRSVRSRTERTAPSSCDGVIVTAARMP